MALGFANPSHGLVSELVRDIETISEEDADTIQETAIYSLCRLVGRMKDSEQMLKVVFSLVRGQGTDCKSVACQRKMVNCVTALGKDSYTKQLLQQAKASQDKMAREMAIMALGKTELVHDNLDKTVSQEMLSIFKDENQNNLDRLAAFNSLKLGKHF